MDLNNAYVRSCVYQSQVQVPRGYSSISKLYLVQKKNISKL